jgi:alcohol dehydrogenase (NADP+)
MSSDRELSACFPLNNGLTMPVLGLGTFQADTHNTPLKDILLAALKKGYRHFDTASAYGNEREVGEALKEFSVARQDIFITTKM